MINRSLANKNKLSYPKTSSGFTIVELLVVIVVIGILAAITIVSYTGITQRATVTTLQSDLSNASDQLEMDQIYNGQFPTTIAAANGGKGLQATKGNTYSDFQVDNTATPTAFCLTETNGGTNYRIMDNSTPSAGTCSRNSCYSILQANESNGSGVYWIKSGGSSFRVYCDMTTAGGGWTLLVSNPGPYTVWNMSDIYSLNSSNPLITQPYSILNKADSIKTNISNNLQYMIDAGSIGRWGGVWQAPYTNTFVGTSIVNNATNIQKFDTWTINTDPSNTLSLSNNIMPWIDNSTQLLSTWGNAGSWFGTLVTGVFWNGGYSPYMSVENPTPNIIWYWVK